MDTQVHRDGGFQATVLMWGPGPYPQEPTLIPLGTPPPAPREKPLGGALRTAYRPARAPGACCASDFPARCAKSGLFPAQAEAHVSHSDPRPFTVRNCGERQRKVYPKEFGTTHLNFWDKDKPLYPVFHGFELLFCRWVVFRRVPGINTVIIGAVRAL